MHTLSVKEVRKSSFTLPDKTANSLPGMWDTQKPSKEALAIVGAED